MKVHRSECYNPGMKTIKADVSNFISFDVEADGPCPGLYSMVSLGMVYVPDPTQTFYATFRPISEAFVPDALKVSQFTREQTLEFPDPQVGILALEKWLNSLNIQGRPIAWSDNPAFDWQFLNYYCQLHLGRNPFGFSCRRIGDFFAGMQNDPRASNHWKRLRKAKHTHNAQALRIMFGHTAE